MLNLIVIRSNDTEHLAEFYSALGLSFERHKHLNGPEHFSATVGNIVFEIYPANKESDKTTGTRLGFNVLSLEKTLARLENLRAKIIRKPEETDYGRRAVVEDFEGHKVEIYQNESRIRN